MGTVRYLRHRLCRLTLVLTFLALQPALGQEPPNQPSQPSPLLEKGHAVDWWFVFKFNAATFPGCSAAQRSCLFGGSVQSYKSFSQQFVYASSDHDALQKGSDCLGDSLSDPVAATFDEVYNGPLFYVIWNDQFYDDPTIDGCTKECGAPWGHSKGLLAWDATGRGLVMQVTTPSWPAAGSKDHPRAGDGNTLGCVKDNDVQVSQHFFALRISESDVLTLLKALENASVVTDPNNPQIVHNGGPQEIQAEVAKLGVKSNATMPFTATLSTGVEVISKPSSLHVPPWQLVSSILGGVSLRAATWWAKPTIPTTTADSAIGCWSDSLSKAGAVEIATTGEWDGTVIGLKGGLGTNFNHAKVGVAISGAKDLSIFGDMNQQGALSDNCASSQNGRGGLFYVVKDGALSADLAALLKGDTAPSR
ncbi:MAG: deoxyribonuclease II family protein [Terracidiphilus sp.]